MDYTEDIFAALDIQDQLQTLYTSGTVFHAFLGEKLPDWQAAAKLVHTIAENYSLPYYTLSPTYSICRTHGYLTGEQMTCPECGEETEVYSRITGYYRPIKNWNLGKIQEFKNRKEYEVDAMKCFQKQQKESVIEKEPITLDLGSEEDGLYLFTTKTCPNCRLAKQYLNGISYLTVDAEEQSERAMAYGIMQAPTLIVRQNGEVQKYANVSDIRLFAERNRSEALLYIN